MRTALVASLLLLGLAACGNRVGSGPCEGQFANPICDQACDPVTAPCPPGFHCAADGTCYAECSQDGRGCRDDHYCSQDGHCEPFIDADCPHVTLTTERTTPTVEIVIDQSGSMTESFGNTNRWNAMRSALIDNQNGVVTNLQAAVYFGATLYTGVQGTCPLLTSVPRALNNRQAIADLLNNNQPRSETPTGESIDRVVDGFMTSPPPPGSPPIIVLATDGEPDTCAVPNPQNGQPEAVAAAQRAFSRGIRLYILSVGSDVGAPHLQDMANAGVGNNPQQTGVQAPYFVANTPQQLSQQLEQIIGGIVSCELQLSGVIDPSAADQGVVVLNGQQLQQGVGWEIVDGDTIRLIGDACEQLLTDPNATVTATFPCGVVVN